MILTCTRIAHPPVIHQNIKPASIIIPQTAGEPVLVVLGIVKAQASVTKAVPYFAPGYGAPEQYSGETSIRTDIYGLGATFYSLLTGLVPPDALYRMRQLDDNDSDPLLSLNLMMSTVPTTVVEAIHRAMSIDSQDRFSTVDQFWEALWQVIDISPSATQVPELAVALPTEENTELDEDPTDPRLSRVMITPPIEENTELDTIQVTPQIPEPMIVESRMELLTLFANPSIQMEPVLVGTSSDLPPTPALPGEGKSPVGVPFQGRSPVHRTKKPGLPLLLFLCLALLVSIGLGSGLWLYITGYHLPSTVIPASAGQFKTIPPAKVTATAVPVTKPYPNVVRPYSGTIYDVPDNLTTKMSLTGIRQSQGNMSGYFTGLHVNGSFRGTIDASSHIEFTVTDSAAHITLSLDGGMQSDGNLSGNFCNLNQEGQCASKYGLWSVAPVL